MNIVLYSKNLFKGHGEILSDFVVQTIYLMTMQNPGYQFFLVVDEHLRNGYNLPANCQLIFIKNSINNALFKKIWWDVKLPGALKKFKAGAFVSFDERCSLSTMIPQCMILSTVQSVKKRYLKKAGSIVVFSRAAKKELVEKVGGVEEKIKVIYPGANNSYSHDNPGEMDDTKNRYSDGKEYFLYNSSFGQNENLIDLPKAFSLFKKRQQSGMKLLILSKSNSFFEKNLATYKYREDVKLIWADEKDFFPKITAAAYAVVLPFNVAGDMAAALNAMQCGVPVIAAKNSPVNDVTEDAALFTGSIKETAEKMMQLYTNETFRSELIERGKQLASGFTTEKTAELWWQSIHQLLH